MVKHLSTLIGTAMILLYFSEFYFLNEGPVKTVVQALEENALNLIPIFGELTLFYAIFAYVLLGSLHWFSVKSITDLFLVGALVGWAIEGIIIPVVYEAVPISFIFPSVSWHGLINVLLGWYIIRRVMRLNRMHYSIAMFTIIGLIWGAWATWFWTDPELQPLTPNDFAFFALAAAALWAVGMALVDYAGTTSFRVSKWEQRVLLVFGGGLAIMMAASAFPFSLAIIPFLWLTVRALRRPVNSSGDAIVSSLAAKPAWWQYSLIPLTPLSASLVYPLFYNANQGVPSETIVFILLLIGSIWLVIAWRRGFSRNSVKPQVPM